MGRSGQVADSDEVVQMKHRNARIAEKHLSILYLIMTLTFEWFEKSGAEIKEKRLI
jgi:hypothetical protein